MTENGFYKIKPEFVDLINRIGGKYLDKKSRPVFCCIKDKDIESLYWAIPTSDYSHRSPKQIDKIKRWCTEKSIRSAYYHIGFTNRPAIYKISNCFPITDKYIEATYMSQGRPLILKNKREIKIIRSKLHRILFDESIHPNKYEQHITDIKNFLIEEIKQNQSIKIDTKNVQSEHTPFNDLLIRTVKDKMDIDKLNEQDIER